MAWLWACRKSPAQGCSWHPAGSMWLLGGGQGFLCGGHSFWVNWAAGEAALLRFRGQCSGQFCF